MSGNRLLSARETARLLHRSVRTLKRWRDDGRGPEYVRTETGGIAYLLSDVNKWLNENRGRSR